MGKQTKTGDGKSLARFERRRALWDDGMVSQHSPHAKLLKNPYAFIVLEAVYRAIPAGTRAGPMYDDPLNSPPDLHDYQQWVHEHLESSGLAKGLAGGPAFLPDITSTLSQPWRLVAKLLTPRNYAQLTRLVLSNLAWYLDQSQRPLTPVHRLRNVFVPASALTVMLTFALWASTGMRALPWSTVILIGCGLGLLIFTVALSLGQNSGRFRANCAELYAYLLKAYAEPEEGEENQINSLLKQLDRETSLGRDELCARSRDRR